MMTEHNEQLTAVLNYFDSVKAFAEAAHRPVFAASCPCGATIEVGRDAAAAERRRIHANWFGLHQHCADRTVKR